MRIDRRTFLTVLGAGGATLAMNPLSLAGRAIGRRAETLLEWERIADGLFVMVDLNTGGNAMGVAYEDGCVLVDSKFPALGAALRRDVMTLTDRDSVTLINTHHHGDHTGGNASFVDDRSYAHEKAIPRIADQLARYTDGAFGGPGQVRRLGAGDELLAMATAMASRADELTAADFTPKHAIAGERTVVDARGVRIELYHFGAGHTDNDLVVHLPERDVLHTGDLVFNTLHPFFDPTGGVTARGWISSLERTLELCTDKTIVVPGHGPIGDRTAIERQIDYLRRLIDAVQADIDAGVSKEDAQEKTHPFMEGLGFEGVRSRAIGAVYDELVGG